MATTTVLRRQRRLSGRWIAAGIIMLVAIVIALVLIRGASRRSTAAGPATVAVTRGSLVAAVAGSGNVAAEQQLDLAFQTAGTVVEVSAQPGDTVKAGQVLARLDDRSLQVQVANAQSSLDGAKARLAQAQSGNARPEDLAAAKAQLAASQANYDKLANGPTAADLAAAQAAVASAQAAYDAANKAAGTSASQLTSAAATVAKTAAALKQAQTAYDQVASLPNIAMLPQSLQLQQATIDYQQAKANYDSLNQTSGTDAQSKVQSAASQLAQARANLAKLTPNAQDLAAAQGNLDQAKANLAKLTAPATTTDLQIQQAAVSQAEGALKQAQLNLDNAMLKAPFAGIVSTVNIVTGSQASSAVPALRLVNRNPLHVDLKLSENDVAQVALDQPVKLTIQSLGGWQTQGKVSYVAPSADTTSGVVTYAVRVNFPDNDAKVKVGMTADLSIVTARKDNVLLIPNTALLPKGAGHVVQVPARDTNGRPTTREVDVQTGLSDGTSTEVLSGLSEGEQIITLPDNGASRRPGGAFFGGG
ncbi:MAG TPA: efflux RND transporter periplasmic adaptor subunit [Anaerolineae bacterium]